MSAIGSLGGADVSQLLQQMQQGSRSGNVQSIEQFAGQAGVDRGQIETRVSQVLAESEPESSQIEALRADARSAVERAQSEGGDVQAALQSALSENGLDLDTLRSSTSDSFGASGSFSGLSASSLSGALGLDEFA